MVFDLDWETGKEGVMRRIKGEGEVEESGGEGIGRKELVPV